MISILDVKAYALKGFFDFFGSLGSPALNFGLTKELDVFADLRYGAETEQCLDVLRPRHLEGSPSNQGAPESGGLALLVYFHGGGWISANKKIYKGIAARFARNGFLTFNVNYRLAPKNRFSAPLQDAAQAIDWIQHNARNYGGDNSVIVLAGDSAGAQIASWYASALHNDKLFHQTGIRRPTRRPNINGLLLFYGVYDFDSVLDARFPFIKIYARSFLGGTSKAYSENSKLASPIRQVSPDLPPVWLCAGEKDGLFPQSKAYAKALEDQGVRCQTLFFSAGYRANHGFLFFRWLKSSKTAVAAAVDFVRDVARTERLPAPSEAGTISRHHPNSAP